MCIQECEFARGCLNVCVGEQSGGAIKLVYCVIAQEKAE